MKLRLPTNEACLVADFGSGDSDAEDAHLYRESIQEISSTIE